MDKLITVSPSPHYYGDTTVRKLMYGVIYALLPAFFVSLYFFGIGALIVTAISVAACIAFEYLIQKYIMKAEPSISDGSAMVTGLLLAFNLPANLPWWIIIIGALVSIGVGKMTFGGLGNNIFNPALVGRVFLFISFPVQMTSWPTPIASRMQYTDAVTGPTPLGIMKEGFSAEITAGQLIEQIPGYMELFLGHMRGCIGEISAFALIVGGIYMLLRKIITWHIPVSIILSVLVFTGILWLINPYDNADPLFHLLSGGLMLGAIYMATDYVTSPMTPKGMWIFGIGIGVITVAIRVFGAYPEGVSFAILIMNAFVPLINKYIKPKGFGEEVNNG
ncbi:MAG: RnfABCDGE type electron transport complex subunit D [Bacteroidales bacterium]